MLETIVFRERLFMRLIKGSLGGLVLAGILAMMPAALHLLTVAITIILLRVLLEFASPPIQLGTNSRSASSDSPLFCDKAVHPLTDASCATPSFVTSTMRNRALPWIMRA